MRQTKLNTQVQFFKCRSALTQNKTFTYVFVSNLKDFSSNVGINTFLPGKILTVFCKNWKHFLTKKLLLQCLLKLSSYQTIQPSCFCDVMEILQTINSAILLLPHSCFECIWNHDIFSETICIDSNVLSLCLLFKVFQVLNSILIQPVHSLPELRSHSL